MSHERFTKEGKQVFVDNQVQGKFLEVEVAFNYCTITTNCGSRWGFRCFHICEQGRTWRSPHVE